jgi:hypothetical protein
MNADRPLMRREMLEASPPFSRNISLSGIDNRRDRLIRARYTPGWLGSLLALSSDSRTILRRKFAVASDSISGLIMGDFSILPLPPGGT